MPNITIKEILASDKISELVDKINFNFDQLLLNGGGPIGPIGTQGEIGPIGPRGTAWFTAADIYTTSLSPTWSGIEEMVNDPNVSGYPQYKGDPNKYLPVGLGSFPENTYKIGYSGKQLRTGDLYLQESDDSVNSIPSFDGDIWQYDIDSGTWVFTGVNIKGESGNAGANALSEWIREDSGLDDIVYPKQIPGQNIARVSIGSDPTQAFSETHPNSKLSVIGDGNELVAFLERSLHGGSAADAATITMTGSGNFILKGSLIGSQRQIQLQTTDANIFLDNGIGQTYTLDAINFRHNFTGGPIRVLSPDPNSIHSFENASGRNIQIKLATSISHAIDSNLNIVFQKTGGNKIGIGNITAAPANLLTVAGNMSIGDAYKAIVAPANGLIVEGNTGIGYSAPLNKLSVAGGLSVNSNQNLNPSVSRTVAEFTGGGSFLSGGVEIDLRSDTNNVVGENNIIKLSSNSFTIWGRIGKVGDKIAISSSASGTSMNGIILSTNNNDPVAGTRVFIDNNGDVGIGTGITTPTAKLDVDGKIKIRQGNPGVNKVLISEDAAGLAKWEDLGTLVSASGQGVPTGTVLMWGLGVASIPTGWVLCDRRSVSTSTPLGQLLVSEGSPYGVDFAGRPRVPDLRERFIVGAGGTGSGNTTVIGNPYAVGDAGGANSVTLTASQSGLPVHDHGPGNLSTNTAGVHNHTNGYTMNVIVEGGSVPKDAFYGTDGSTEIARTNDALITDAGAHSHTVNAGRTEQVGGTSAIDSHENRPPYFALCFIIKTN